MATVEQMAESKAKLEQAVGGLLDERGMSEEFITQAVAAVGRIEASDKELAEVKQTLANVQQLADKMAADNAALQKAIEQKADEPGELMRAYAPDNPYHESPIAHLWAADLYYTSMLAGSPGNEAYRSELALIKQAAATTREKLQPLHKRVMQAVYDKVEQRYDARGRKMDAFSAYQRDRAMSAWGHRRLEQAWSVDDPDMGGDNFLAVNTYPGLWQDIILAASVFPNLMMAPMVRNKQEIRRMNAEPFRDWKFFGDDVVSVQAFQDYAANAKQTLTARTFASYHLITSAELEDADLPMPGTLMDALVEGGRRAIDAAVVSGDTATTGNINNNNGTGAAASQMVTRGVDGLRKYALGDSGRQINANAAISWPLLMRLRGALGAAGQNPADVTFAMPLELYYVLLGLEDFSRYNYYSDLATALTGQLTAIGMGRIAVCDSYVYPQRVNAAGSVDGTPANNDTHSMLCVSNRLNMLGLRTPPMFVPQYTANVAGLQLTARMRLGLITREGLEDGNQAVAMMRNITIG